MAHKKLPSITFITTTYNANLALFKQSLESISNQRYPKQLLEHIVVDGGSSNGTIAFAKAHKCKVFVMADLAQEQEMRASMGIKKAKGELYALMQSDNILTSDDWLEKMVEPFLENKDIFCTFSAYNAYKKNMPLTTRYCALFGSTDPALYYLGKSEKIPLTQERYNLGKIVKETKNYYAVRFGKNNLPTIGDNGHLIKRRVMNEVNTDLKRYTHTDAIFELVSKGHNTFGVVKNSIIHMANPSIINLVKRRVEVKKKYSDEWRGKRKYFVFSWQSERDRMNLIKYLFFSFTFVEPFMQSLSGYIKIRDKAWFLHPVLCPLMAVGYGYSEITFLLNRLLQKKN